MNNSIVKLENISKSYYTKDVEVLAIDKVSLDIKENEIVAIVGPSGCGKSTLLNIIGGLDSKTAGEIIFNSDKNKIGYMFQTDCLFPWLNILDNCLLGLKVNDTVSEDVKKEVIEMLKSYGLEEFIYSYPNNLSGGMRQRVG